MHKNAWHTDIVVGGQGMNVKVAVSRAGCARLVVMPDVPGKKADKAYTRFMKATRLMPKSCSVARTKKAVEHAVRTTGARWNRWHHETY